MLNENRICKACGGSTFAQGQINNGYSRVMPINKTFSWGSGLLLTFCKKCGEVASVKVENPQKF